MSVCVCVCVLEREGMNEWAYTVGSLFPIVLCHKYIQIEIWFLNVASATQRNSGFVLNSPWNNIE